MAEGGFWEYGKCAERDPGSVVEAGVEYTGDFWTDVLTVSEANKLPLHPCFRMPRRNPQTPAVRETSLSRSKTPNVTHPPVPPAEEEVRRLTNFSLHSQRLDAATLKVLEFVISHHDTCRSLKFDNCMLEEKCMHLIVSMAERALVTSLSVDWNVGLPGASYAGLLKPESKLKRLTLRSCGIDSEALGAIGQFLVSNATLTVLDLYGNNFTSIEPLAKALAVNRVLEHLNIAKSGLTHEQIDCLVPIMGKHPFPSEKVDEHRKLEKERDTIKTRNSKTKKAPEPVPFVDEIEQNPETAGWMVVKNNVLMTLNLSMNRIGSAAGLESIMQSTKQEFLVFLALNEGFGEEEKARLQMAYGDRLYL